MASEVTDGAQVCVKRLVVHTGIKGHGWDIGSSGKKWLENCRELLPRGEQTRHKSR